MTLKVLLHEVTVRNQFILYVAAVLLGMPLQLQAGQIDFTLAIPPEAANPIDSFTFGPPPPHGSSFHEVIFTLPMGPFVDELQKDVANGTHIPAMILTDTNNVTKAVEEFTFGDDFVARVVIGGISPGQPPNFNVTVDYVSLTTTFVSPAPEPSSLLLLGTGLLGLVAAARRKRLA